MDDAARQRARNRQHWPIMKAHLGDETDDIITAASASTLVAMVWQLTRDAWALSGKPIPSYRKAEMPGRMQRGRGSR